MGIWFCCPRVKCCCFCTRSLRFATALICIWAILISCHESMLVLRPTCSDMYDVDSGELHLYLIVLQWIVLISCMAVFLAASSLFSLGVFYKHGITADIFILTGILSFWSTITYGVLSGMQIYQYAGCLVNINDQLTMGVYDVWWIYFIIVVASYRKTMNNPTEYNSDVVPPFKHIFTSFPFLAMVVLHYGSNWGLYFVMTAAPKFVSSALGFNLTSTGTLSSLPYLSRMIFSLVFGAIGDRIVKQNIVSMTFMRKFFCIFSHIVPGLLLIGLGYTGCAPILSVALITFSMGSNGAATLTNLVNHQDLAPNYAGTLYGIANGIGNTAGFITPLVTAYFTQNGNSFEEWRPVFFTGASLYIAAAFYFILFGTAETQSWNYITPEPEEEDKRPSANSTDTTITIPVKS